MPQQFSGLMGLLIMLTLAACAVADVPSTTNNPPIVLPAPPTPVFMGSCDDMESLEGWAQTAFFLTRDFTASLNTAGQAGRGEMTEHVLKMADLRNAMANKPTPDCAVEAQNQLLMVMNEAVDTFQAYHNGELANLGSAVSDYNARIDQARALQDELIIRLNQQLEAAGLGPTEAVTP